MRKDEQTREIVECDAERGLEFISDAGADSNGKAVALGHDAAHAGKLALVERPDVLDVQRLVKRRAEHHAALPNHLARKQREHAAGG